MTDITTGTRRPLTAPTQRSSRRMRATIALAGLMILTVARPATATDGQWPPSSPPPVNGGVVFDGDATTFDSIYGRTPSASHQHWLDALADGEVDLLTEVIPGPLKHRGAPGVAVFDYDNDSDLDLFVTNGPGTANSLYASQFADSGELHFVDVASSAGVTNVAADSTGVCAGDVDNDGDADLLVLAIQGANSLYENQGDGTFADISISSTLGQAVTHSTSCSMGDVNNDGLLDIAVANGWDMETLEPIFIDPFAGTQPNQLFLNLGNNVLAEAAASSGYVVDHPGITWAIVMVDYDRDGDIDLIEANDQGLIPKANADSPFMCQVCPPDSGIDHGFIRLFNNDGLGHFSDVTVASGLAITGMWMGLAAADFDGNGTIDVMAANFGDYANQLIGVPSEFGDRTSRWFLNQGDGTFTDPGIGDLVSAPFGWGVGALDYDNDGDTDVVMNGGMDAATFIDAPKAWTLLNDGSGRFTYDEAAMRDSGYHERRTVNGQAHGDLNGDGFIDVVTVSNFDIDQAAATVPYPVQHGAGFEPARFVPSTDLIEFPLFSWSDPPLSDGSLAVDVNRGGNGNRSVQVSTVGSVGLTDGAVSNRDGIGAVVAVTPSGLGTTVLPRTGGSSYASQNSPVLTFGIGNRHHATVEVTWPGGVTNRLYGVRPGEHIRFPEIPCATDDAQGLKDHLRCIVRSLNDLEATGEITRIEAVRFKWSAIRHFVSLQWPASRSLQGLGSVSGEAVGRTPREPRRDPRYRNCGLPLRCQ